MKQFFFIKKFHSLNNYVLLCGVKWNITKIIYIKLWQSTFSMQVLLLF